MEYKRLLKKGLRGEDVKVVQSALRCYPDGIFGEMTEKAVKDWQEEHGLEVDGIVGPKTWDTLGIKVNVCTKSTKDIHIIMNYGHAKSTPGKYSPLYSTLSKEDQAYFAKYPQFGTDRYYEYLSNRVIGRQITASLRERGWNVHEIVQTGPSGLAEIVNATNKICKQYGNDKCVFISVHSNAAQAKENEWVNAKGWCIYTTRGQNKSDIFADYIYKYANEYFVKQDKRRIRKDLSDGDPDQEANFYVIKHCNCPGVLTENFFFNDKEDLKYIVSEEGQNSIVRAHVMGIEEFIYKELLK